MSKVHSLDDQHIEDNSESLPTEAEKGGASTRKRRIILWASRSLPSILFNGNGNRHSRHHVAGTFS